MREVHRIQYFYMVARCYTGHGGAEITRSVDRQAGSGIERRCKKSRSDMAPVVLNIMYLFLKALCWQTGDAP